MKQYTVRISHCCGATAVEQNGISFCSWCQEQCTYTLALITPLEEENLSKVEEV